MYKVSTDLMMPTREHASQGRHPTMRMRHPVDVSRLHAYIMGPRMESPQWQKEKDVHGSNDMDPNSPRLI